jgi:hypothetical protein
MQAEVSERSPNSQTRMNQSRQIIADDKNLMVFSLAPAGSGAK